MKKLSRLPMSELVYYKNIPIEKNEYEIIRELNNRVGKELPIKSDVSSTTFGLSIEGGHVNSLALYDVGLSFLPENISQLNQLKKLYLAKNNLTTLPSSLSSLDKLQELDLRDNPLNGLPKCISELNLQILYLNKFRWNHLPEIIGFALLSGFTLLLYLSGLYESFQHHVILVIYSFIMVFFLLYGIFTELKNIFNRFSSVYLDNSSYSFFSLDNAYDFLSVFFGAVITFFISTELGLGAVIASGLVGLFGGLLIKKHAVAIFCGSFIGMCSIDLLTLFPCIVLAGLLGGTIFISCKKLFPGLGGKLGTIAFISSILTSVVVGNPLLSGSMVGLEDNILLVFYSVCGAVFTYIISIRFKHGAVVASAFVGLVGGLILPIIHNTTGVTFAVAVFCASFAGMSSREHFKSEMDMIFVGIICGLTFVLTTPHLGGAGGKLGTIAFGSVIILSSIYRITNRIKNKLKKSSQRMDIEAT